VIGLLVPANLAWPATGREWRELVVFFFFFPVHNKFKTDGGFWLHGALAALRVLTMFKRTKLLYTMRNDRVGTIRHAVAIDDFRMLYDADLMDTYDERKTQDTQEV